MIAKKCQLSMESADVKCLSASTKLVQFLQNPLAISASMKISQRMTIAVALSNQSVNLPHVQHHPLLFAMNAKKSSSIRSHFADAMCKCAGTRLAKFRISPLVTNVLSWIGMWISVTALNLHAFRACVHRPSCLIALSAKYSTKKMTLVTALNMCANRIVLIL